MKELIKFLNESPNAFLAVENITKVLKDNDYIELSEKDKFNIKKGNKYFVTRNGSSIIAFNVGKSLKDPCLLVSA
ncbi:MAG: M18 family aminopeptidase, partial [Bacilli bacterium]|nr:M18 family aminopeptidase [Bacilli bacterium]